jgi:hypothetical protein
MTVERPVTRKTEALSHPGTETRIPVGTSGLQASLIIQGGPNSGTTLPLSHRPITLGRRPDNDLVVDEASVSRRHALIMETPQGFAVRDLNTKNGTFVNRIKVGEGENLLEHGDRIRLAAGDVTFIFRQEGAPTITMGRPSPTPLPGRGPSIPGHSVDKPAPEKKNGAAPSLTPKQIDLLRLLESRKGSVVSRDDIHRSVWPELPGGARVHDAIDDSIYQLRASAGDDLIKPVHLLTVGEFGFLLV